MLLAVFFGADVNAQDGRALLEAVRKNHAEMACFLITVGADVHAQHNLNLLAAAHLDNAPLLALLLQESTNMSNIPLPIGLSRFSHAVQTTWLREAKVLPALDPVRLALVGACPEAVCILLERRGHEDLATMLTATQILDTLTPDARADFLEELLAQHIQPENQHVNT